MEAKNMGRSFMRMLGFLIISLLIGFPCESLAETTAEGPDVYSLGEVVVTGQRPVVESAGTVREISAKEMATRKVRNLKEALEMLPGVDIRTATDGVARIDVRGFRSRHVLLLLNGIPFNSTFDGQFDPALIPVENIAKIKVSYGNSSVLYGQGALGGVINVITKKGTEGTHGSVGGEAGERNSYLGRFSLSGAGKSFNYFASGSVLDSDGYVLSDDFKPTSEENGEVRENSDREHRNLFANIGFAPSDQVDIGLVANYLKGQFGKPPITINDNTDIFANRPRYDRIDDYEGVSAQLSMDLNLTGPFDLRAWLFGNSLDENENRYDDSHYNSMDLRNSYALKNQTDIYGGTLQAVVDMSTAGSLAFSFSGEEQSYEADGYIRDVNLGGGNWGLRSLTIDKDIKVYSAGLEYEVNPVDDLGVVLGYSHHWLEKDGGSSDDEGGFLAGVHYNLLENTRLRGSVARKVRFPSIRQLYDEDGGNLNLTTEKSTNYELGIDQTIAGDTMLSLTGFYMEVEDYIERSDITDLFENNEEYLFKGVELTAETHYISRTMLRAGYTYMETEDKSPGTEKDELQYRPKHKFSLEGSYTFNFGLEAYASVRHVADIYYYSRTTPLQKRALDDYTVVKINLDQALLKDRLHVYVGVDNLFDLDYEEAYGYPREGRNLYAGAEVRF
jgi:outer membrane cobalamin receptor